MYVAIQIRGSVGIAILAFGVSGLFASVFLGKRIQRKAFLEWYNNQDQSALAERIEGEIGHKGLN